MEKILSERLYCFVLNWNRLIHYFFSSFVSTLENKILTEYGLPHVDREELFIKIRFRFRINDARYGFR
jgi:hypothetical protein